MEEKRRSALLRSRKVDTEVFENGENSVVAVGRLVDIFNVDIVTELLVHPKGVFHDLSIEMDIRLPDLTITDVRVDMATVPFEACQEIIPAYDCLKGMRIGQGFSRAVKHKLDGVHGCTHLTSLILSMPTIALHGGLVKMISDAQAKQPQEALSAEKVIPSSVSDSFLRDNCHMWREGGPLASLLWKEQNH